ncbi:MAG: sporulation transcription factor Spo0A [Aristaeellaceae bacterium]
MGEIKVLLVDDNAELRHSMKVALEAHSGLRVCGECNNGLEALEALGKYRVDVMVTDIIMPQMDGYTCLEEMQRQQLAHMPQTIVISALSRDDFITRAIELGARYYMVKPLDTAALANRIMDICGAPADTGKAAPTHTGRTTTLDEKLASLFLTIGIPAHIKGYQFLREAVKMVIDDPNLINSITKELYPGVARRCGSTASKVERAIRHAIEVAWNRGRVEMLNKIFGCRVASQEDKPTNGEFIAMLADRMAMNRKSAS